MSRAKKTGKLITTKILGARKQQVVNNFVYVRKLNLC